MEKKFTQHKTHNTKCQQKCEEKRKGNHFMTFPKLALFINLNLTFNLNLTKANNPNLILTSWELNLFGGKPYNCHINIGQWFFHNITSWMFY